MKALKIRISFTEELLGTANSDPKIHEEFIASNAPDAPSRAEEVETLGVNEVVEKQKTIFPKDEEGNPIIWDYQIKGFSRIPVRHLERWLAQGQAKSKPSKRKLTV